MKAVIFAGGFGARLSEETDTKPKPMIEVGGRPILWHIMKLYGHYGINDFIICLGYRGYMIKEYFANYFMHMSDVTFDFEQNSMEVHHKYVEPWRVTLIDTSLHTMTGGRLARVQEHIGDQTFCMTYGDGVGDIDIDATLAYHREHGLPATMTATQPPGRFGRLDMAPDGLVNTFIEKPLGDGDWINGGFFVLEPGVFKYLNGDDTIWERAPLEQLAKEGQLGAYQHSGFWKPMDTLRDLRTLESLWEAGKAPWQVWD